ncbi:MAG: DNA-processing protein DprA [Pseudomonadota bacterium]
MVKLSGAIVAEAARTEQETLAWLALLLAPGGPATLNTLLAETPDPQQLLRAPPTSAREKFRAYARKPDWKTAEAHLSWLQQQSIHLIPITDSSAYPTLLHRLSDAPTVLFVHGNPDLLHLPQLAVVGSRHASQSGFATAKQFCGHLAQHGMAITSGMALGIDTAAHQGALSVQGHTIAVAGTGLDRVYPARNHQLAHQIVQQGALVSEYLPGTKPLRHHFPRRNRVIAGLSLGVLVVEAALKSGSLITARLANELGREVFAIPGSIHNPLARGCHRLIRQGAKLVETAEHIVEELGAALNELSLSLEQPIPATEQPASTKLTDEHQTLLDAMGFDPISADQLVQRTGMSAAEVSSILLLLELQNQVSSVPGGLFLRAPS